MTGKMWVVCGYIAECVGVPKTPCPFSPLSRNTLNHNRLSLRGLLPTLESEPGSLTRSCGSDPLPERVSKAAVPPSPPNFDSHRGVAEEIGIQEERLHQRMEAGGHTLTRPPGTQDLSGAVRSPLLTHPSPEVSPLATSLLADCGHLGRGMSGVLHHRAASVTKNERPEERRSANEKNVALSNEERAASLLRAPPIESTVAA